VHRASPEKSQAMSSFFINVLAKLPLALEEMSLCPQDCRLDCLKKSPEDKGSADQPGTENQVNHIFHYIHS